MTDGQQITIFLYVSKFDFFDIPVVSLPGIVVYSVEKKSLVISPNVCFVYWLSAVIEGFNLSVQ